MGESVAVRRVKRKGTPGPNKYDIRKDLLWGKCKKISLKERLVSKTRELGPGPAAHVKLSTSLGGPKHTMATKPKTAAIHGLVSALANVPSRFESPEESV
ncbi:hypothetical protein ElyMa_002867600 [Elysia marginata]|uniref:Uncharacterized protein n=1 Tax=Elysia marginata TaxID=1093978 RepID=A0AAV4HXY5_9GAST|nr:hypothetical protein ElyMa_002867600 [Elysia marginata]